MKRTTDWFFELDLGDVVFDIEGDVEYDVTPGDPGCRYTPNGDGWPPSPPEVEFWNERVTKLTISLTLVAQFDDIVVPVETLTPNQKEYLTAQFEKVRERLAEDTLANYPPEKEYEERD